ncbi:MAG: polysaccharide ABC transporter ATP-binding protein [Planctomycetota bacterium]
MENRLSVKIDAVTQVFPRSIISQIRTMKSILTGITRVSREGSVVALDDVSFEIKDGERIGIIGSNGSGKTTLLNIIAGFLTPTSGSVTINGKVNALMSIGVGIREEMTGVENIYVNGGLHGKTRAEIDALKDEIIRFADIGDYINKPVRTYSSGMKARLGFAMLLFIEPEILIIDEVLGVGDADFAVKSSKKIEELCSKGKTLIIVSHDMQIINQMTQRTIWLEKGKMMLDGDSQAVARAYLNLVRQKEEEEVKKKFAQRVKETKTGSRIWIKDFHLRSGLHQEKTIFDLGEKASVNIRLEATESVKEWDIVLSFIKMDGTLIMQNQASEDGLKLPALSGGQSINLDVGLGELFLAEGVYEVLLEITSENKTIAKSSLVLKMQNFTVFTLSRPDYYCRYQIKAEE